MSSLVHFGGRTSQRSHTSATVLQFAFALAKAILGWPGRVYANRKLLHQMAGMSACELADIGLTPGDLQDTAALPMDAEVGGFLADRAADRRHATIRRRR